MYHKSDWIELGLLLLAFLLGYLGIRLAVPLLFNLGSACIGMFALVAGIAALRTGRVGFETRQKNFGPVSLYTGLAARLYGGLFIAFALLVFVLTAAAVIAPGGATAFWQNMLGKPWGWGLIMLGIGLALVVTGLIRMMQGSGGYYKGVAEKVQRVSGILPLVLGLLLFLVGLLLLFLPKFALGLGNQLWNGILHIFSG